MTYPPQPGQHYGSQPGARWYPQQQGPFPPGGGHPQPFPPGGGYPPPSIATVRGRAVAGA